MKTKAMALTMGVVAMAAASTMAATVDKWTGGSNGNWTNTANWSKGALPESYTDGVARFDGASEGAIINSALAATVYRLEMGRGAAAGTLAINAGGSITIDQFRIAASAGTDTGTVEINGGALTINGGNHGIGYVGTGVVNLNSGTFNSTDDIIVGRGGADANGTLNVLGGTLATVGQISVGGRYISSVATGGVGAFNLSAGTATVGTDLKVGNGGDGTLTVGGTADLTVGRLLVGSASGYTGVANLTGGAVHADKVVIGLGGTLNLAAAATLDSYTNMSFQADGLLVWEGNHTNDVATMVGDGTLSWYDATATYDDARAYDQEYDAPTGWLRTKYDAGNGETQVWTVIPEPDTLGLMAVVGAGLLFVRRRRFF